MLFEKHYCLFSSRVAEHGQVDYIKILGENRMFKTNKLVFAEEPGRSPPYAGEGSGVW